ncbi:fasciclin-like arabinogalactan protein 11 [Phtheirospermum japonicum]|uniref:Fasciclin-like arabinogalactan protein 11 n=1 Tax=Phtheirospermum japonicum TaxID=374723 RepID=A0A830DL87_9LAMI|nr:fasciclin-like arabinogalactan protein 11 [Phtheirospermum japonicum]
MKQYFSFCLSFLLLLFLQSSKILTLAQTPAPAPTGPTNITKILEKAGQFTTFIHLLQTTQTADRINTQLKSSDEGLTIFAPSDAAFSALQTGTLNSLNDQQKTSIVLFHILPTFLSISQFQTVSNPMRTQAGDTGRGQFPLNITTSGDNQVNITTGINNATVGGTIYTDGQLAVYQVDNVLLPLSVFDPLPAPAPAPVAPKPKKAAPAAVRGVATDASDAGGGAMHGMIGAVGVAIITAFY